MTTEVPSDPAASDAPTPRPLTGGVVMSATSRVTVAVTGAATTILIARLLGPDGAGGFAIALTLIAILTAFSTLGVEHGITYYVSSGRWAPRNAYRAAQRVAVASGVVGAGVGVAARLLIPSAFGDLSVAMAAVIAGSLPFALSWFYATYVALAVDRYEAYVIPPAIQSAGGLVLVGILGAVVGLDGAILGIALSHVLTAAVVAVASRRHMAGGPIPDREPRQLRRAIKFGIKGYAANALQFLNYRVDIFILAGVATVAEVGYYSVAISVTSVMWLLPRALSDVLFPRIATLSAHAAEDSLAIRTFVETKSVRHTVLIVLFSSLALVAAMLLLIVPVYGSDFRPAIDLGLIMLPGVALIGVSGPLSASFVGRGHPGYALVITLVVTPLTIVLYALLIPAMEATGAALASSISYVCTFVLVLAFYRYVVGEPVLGRLIPSRSELADYRSLMPAIKTWAGNILHRRNASSDSSRPESRE